MMYSIWLGNAHIDMTKALEISTNNGNLAVLCKESQFFSGMRRACEKTPAKLQSSSPIRNGFRETIAIDGVTLPENGWLEYRIFRGSVSFREGTI